jgi:hypothetical protein
MELPPLRLAEWEDTRLYLQLVCQIVGKTRLKLHPPLNHWWHVTLYLSPTGLTTGGIPYRGSEVEVGMDLFRHTVWIQRGEGRRELPLGGSIADFYGAYRAALQELGIEVKMLARPYDCKSTIPFSEDREHSTYDPAAAHRAWTVLAQMDGELRRFRSGFIGKCSPVHMFWHSFDLACTRFSGRRAPAFEADARTQEAYSHEVVSAGFWFGDDSVSEAALYAYAAPAPEGLMDRPLKPASASWMLLRGAPMALLRYGDIRSSPDPAGSIREFLQSSYEAGAEGLDWNRSELERP